MKSLIISILLFALLVGAVAVNAFYVSSLCKDLSATATELISSQSRSTQLAELKSKWDKHRIFLDIGIRTSELERMNDLIEGLRASYAADNEAEFQKYCILISELAEEFASYEKISFKSLCHINKFGRIFSPQLNTAKQHCGMLSAA